MNDYAVTITYQSDENDPTSLTTLVLDTIDDTSTESHTTISTHPLVNGDMVADHMYNDPNSMTISGRFSLNGKRGIVVDTAGSRLENVQDIFESLQKNGTLCDIVKIHTVDDTPQFKRRTNMVLQNISWTESINSLQFTFSFTEVMLVKVTQEDVVSSDPSLPDVTEPQTLNFTDTLIDWNQINALINSAFTDLEFVTDEFLQYLRGMTATSLVALGVALVVAKIVAVASVSRVAALAAVVIVVAYGMIKTIKAIVDKARFKVKKFKLSTNEETNKQEVQRYCKLVGTVYDALQELNDTLHVFSVSSNKPQECLLTIDNEYYIFTFTRNNTNQQWTLNVQDINSNSIRILNDISGTQTDLSQCTDDNALFRTETGSYVYLIKSENSTDLTGYFILVSDDSLSEFSTKVQNIIRQTVLR